MSIVTRKKEKTPFSSEDIEYVMTKRGEPIAVIISIDKFRSMAETLDIMTDKELMKSIARAKKELKKGRQLLTHEEVFSDL